MSIHELKQQIISKFGSIHAFCKAYPELKRSTVYLVFSGRYAGKVETQINIIVNVLNNVPQRENIILISNEKFIEVLQDIRCNNCRRLDKRQCSECKIRTRTEGLQLYKHLF